MSPAGLFCWGYTKVAENSMPATPVFASFRFYGELNDHLPPGQRNRAIPKSFIVSASAKDMIESLGVPHPEVDLILVNGDPADFSRLIRSGDRVAVYPAFESIDISSLLHHRPQALAEPKFVVDVHLGRLAAYLRMLGFDAIYDNNADDSDLVRMSREQQRTLLTRDRGVLKHSAVIHGYWVRETDTQLQLAEIVNRFDLARLLRPFSRCMVCNELLKPASKKEISSRVPPRVLEWCEEFRECRGCRRVYWEGSHSLRMRSWMERISGRQCANPGPGTAQQTSPDQGMIR